MDLQPVTVTATAAHGEGLVTLSFTLPPALREAFLHPGQALQLRPPGAEKPSWFAAASPPSAAELTVLIRPTDGTAGALARLTPGEVLHAGPPTGPGFPLAPLRGHDVLCVAGGTAIAPFRSLLLALAEERAAYGSVTLFQGARTDAGLVFAAELAALPGVRVVTSGDGPSAELPQAWLAREAPPLHRTIALLGGPPPMIAAVTEVLRAGGLPPERILQNW